MDYVLYPLVMARDGRKTGEFPLGTVSFDDENGVKVDCPDVGLNRRLTEFFSTPRRVRRKLGSVDTVLTYTWEELEPGTEEYFQGSISRLHCLGCVPKLFTA